MEVREKNYFEDSEGENGIRRFAKSALIFWKLHVSGEQLMSDAGREAAQRSADYRSSA